MDTKDLREKEEKPGNEKEVKVDDKMVQIIIDSSSEVSLDDFQINDKKVLSLLNQDSDVNDNQYTFNGLARKLGIHQQSLSRSLHRLESAGLVKKTDYGYTLTKSLDSMLVKKSRIDLENLSKTILHQYAQFEQIIQLYIPTTVKVEDIITKLLGKWFGTLRWIGIVEGDGGYVLQWTSDNKYHVNLKLVTRYAVVESDAVGANDKSEATINAHRILEHITKLLKENQVRHDGKSRYRSFDLYN
ncbi:MAG: MarR family transcriptional regulator [Nitrosotalea sp.]